MKYYFLSFTEPVFRFETLLKEFELEEDACIRCEISDCPEKYEIYWERRNEQEEVQKIIDIDKKTDPYHESTKDSSLLTITNIGMNDAAKYRCCIKYCSVDPDKECIFESKDVKLRVSKGLFHAFCILEIV